MIATNLKIDNLYPTGAPQIATHTEAKPLQGERFKVGVNSKIVGKTNPDRLSYAGAWETREITIEELADWAGNQAHPWMMATLNGGRRTKANVLEAQVIALDVDNTDKDAEESAIKVYRPRLTIEQAKAHPYIKAHCAAIVPSASHTEAWHKFRLMFILPTPAIGLEAIEAALAGLMEIFPGADPACKDATRFFFGAGHGIRYINATARLPEDFLPKAIAAEREKWRLIEEEQERYRLALQSMDISTVAKHARDAWACIPHRQKGTGTYDLYRAAIAGTINDLGLEGEAIVLAADPMACEKGGTAGFIRSIVRSRSTKRASLKSLVYFAKQFGYKFEPTQEERSAYGKANYTDAQRREYAIAKGWIHPPSAKTAPTKKITPRAEKTAQPRPKRRYRAKLAVLIRRERVARKRYEVAQAKADRMAGKNYPQARKEQARLNAERLGTIAEDLRQQMADSATNLRLKATRKQLIEERKRLDKSLCQGEIKAGLQALMRHEAEKVLGLFPDLVQVNTRNMDEIPMLPWKHVASNAVNGAGKNKLVERETLTGSFLSLTHRRILAQAHSERFYNTVFRNELYRNQGRYETDRLCSTLNGLEYIDPMRQWPKGVDHLVLDEVSQLLAYLDTAPTVKKHKLIIDRLRHLLWSAKRIYIIDTDVSAEDLKLLDKWSGGRILNGGSVFIQNNYKPAKKRFSRIIAKGVDSAIAYMASLVNPNSMALFMVDSSTTADKVALALPFGKILKITKDEGELNAADPAYMMAYEAVLKGDSQLLKALGYVAVILNPSVVEGISFTDGGFSQHFALFTGCTIPPRSMRQQLMRDRLAEHWYIYCVDEAKRYLETDPAVIARNARAGWGFAKRQRDEYQNMPSLQIDELIEYTAQRQAIENQWKKHPWLGLEVLLEDWGFEINTITTTADGTPIDEMHKAFKQARRAEIVDSPQYSEEDVLRLKKIAEEQGKRRESVFTSMMDVEESESRILSREERLGLKRAKHCKFYAIDPDRLSVGLLELDDDDRAKSKIKRLEALLIPAAFEAAKTELVHDLDHKLPSQHSRLAMQTEFLQELGTVELLREIAKVGLFHKETSLVQAFHLKLLENSDRCAALLGTNPNPELSSCKALNSFLRIALGIEVGKGVRRVVDGAYRWCYAIDACQLDWAIATIDRRCYKKGLTDSTHGRGAALIAHYLELPGFKWGDDVRYAEVLNGSNMDELEPLPNYRAGDVVFPIGTGFAEEEEPIEDVEINWLEGD